MDRHPILLRVVPKLHPKLSDRTVLSVPAPPDNLVLRRISQWRVLYAFKLFLQDNPMILAPMIRLIRLVAAEESVIDGANGKNLRKSTSFSIRPRVLALVLVQEPSEGLGYAFDIPTNRPGAVEITKKEVPVGV